MNHSFMYRGDTGPVPLFTYLLPYYHITLDIYHKMPVYYFNRKYIYGKKVKE